MPQVWKLSQTWKTDDLNVKTVINVKTKQLAITWKPEFHCNLGQAPALQQSFSFSWCDSKVWKALLCNCPSWHVNNNILLRDTILGHVPIDLGRTGPASKNYLDVNLAAGRGKRWGNRAYENIFFKLSTDPRQSIWFFEFQCTSLTSNRILIHWYTSPKSWKESKLRIEGACNFWWEALLLFSFFGKFPLAAWRHWRM